MSRLENELECKLFVRLPNSIEMTYMGDQLLPFAKEIVRLADHCESTMQLLRKAEAELEVYFGLGIISEFAYPVIQKYKREHEKAVLQVREDTDLACKMAVVNRKVEMALVAGPVESAFLDSELLFETPCVLVCNKEHPLASFDMISVTDLKDYPLIVHQPQTKIFSLFTEACDKAEFKPNIDMLAVNSSLVIEQAGSTNCLGLATLTHFQRYHDPNIRAIRFREPELYWRIYQIKQKDTQLTRAGKLLWDMNRAHCNELKQHNTYNG